jgi:hypothetical protein
MESITPIRVKPCHTLVLLTTEEALVLLPDGNWTRTPLKGPQDIASKAQGLAYKKLVIDHVEARQKLAKARLDLAAADLKRELDLAAPPYRWHRKGGGGISF